MNHSLLLNLLGKSPECIELQRFKTTIGEEPQIDDSRSMAYQLFSRSGIAIYVDKRENCIDSIYLYQEGFEGNSQYKGTLPKHATFLDFRTDVRKKLGTPACCGRMVGPSDPPVVDWDLFEEKPYTYHFTFRKDGELLLVVLSLAKFSLSFDLDEILARHDPEGLIYMGAPKDEYRNEATMLNLDLPLQPSEKEIARLLKEIFHARFDIGYFRSQNKETGELRWQRAELREPFARREQRLEKAAAEIYHIVSDRIMNKGDEN